MAKFTAEKSLHLFGRAEIINKVSAAGMQKQIEAI